jgi:hypothetical protein
MKKFGTPIGDGPGSEREKEGLDAEGTPLPDGSPALCLALWCFGDAFFLVVEGAVCLEGRWRLVGRVGLGAGAVEDPEVVVEDELEPEWVPVLEVVVDEDVVVRGGGELDVVVDDEELDGVQDSLSEVITPVTGRFRDQIGVPAGAFT